MTDYDRGEFVRNRPILIEPCANGTFTVLRGRSADEIYPRLTESMGFSSAADLMRFLQSEFSMGATEPGPESPEATHKCTCWACSGKDAPHDH